MIQAGASGSRKQKPKMERSFHFWFLVFISCRSKWSQKTKIQRKLAFQFFFRILEFIVPSGGKKTKTENEQNDPSRFCFVRCFVLTFEQKEFSIFVFSYQVAGRKQKSKMERSFHFLPTFFAEENRHRFSARSTWQKIERPFHFCFRRVFLVPSGRKKIKIKNGMTVPFLVFVFCCHLHRLNRT